MPNTSASGGYLAPAQLSPPLEGDALDDEFQKAVVGITGIAGALVRPRWQAKPPKQPAADVDWCALGIATQSPDAGPHIQHNGAGDGTDIFTRHESIRLLLTFYGPNAKRNAATMRDGIQMPQNMEQLALADIGLVGLGEIQAVPELVNQQWVKRYDLPMQFNRQIVRVYGVQNIVEADPILISDTIGIITN